MITRHMHPRLAFAVTLVAILLAISAPGVHAQDGSGDPQNLMGIAAPASDWDPYVREVIISPAPLLPVEFNGTGVGTLRPGNNGGFALPLGSPTNPNDLMTVVISLGNGVPNVANPQDPADALTALGGPGKIYWDWTYNPSIRTYTGVQNQVIPAYTAELITVQYKVTENTPVGNAFNGLNVNIQPPGYTNPQPTDNDKASSYTYVQARDFGDAPNSYGEAYHEVDAFTKNPSLQYTQFFWLGPTVDVETSYPGSALATGDDDASTSSYPPGTDDEDGVTLPTTMWAGEVATIPVQWTYHPSSAPTLSQRSYAYLTAWIDWNGDGVFDDSDGSAEVISHTWDPLNAEWVYGHRLRVTGTRSIVLTVPVDAVTYRPIYARFRLSTQEKSSPNDPAFNGEVEDYWIDLNSPLAVDLALFGADAAADGVTINWETVSEQNNAGFNLYRAASPEGPWTKLNETLIAAQAPGSSEGRTYQWVDLEMVEPGVDHATAQLEDIALDGASTLHPPVEVTLAAPNAVNLSGFAGSAGLPPALSGLFMTLLAGVAGLAGPPGGRASSAHVGASVAPARMRSRHTADGIMHVRHGAQAYAALALVPTHGPQPQRASAA